MSSESKIFHRTLTKEYPVAVSGEGIYVHLKSPQPVEHPPKILDACCGAAVSCLGHGHPVPIEAIVKQVREMPYAHTSWASSEVAEELAKLMCERSKIRPGAEESFAKVMFLSSGSEAIESALKLCRIYHVSKKDPSRINFIGRFDSYHGNTLGALAIGYSKNRRDPFAPILSENFHHVNPCFYHRDGNGRSEEQYVSDLLEEMEAKIQQIGPSTVAGILVEPIVGATLAAVPACEGYLAGLRNLCDRYGALLLFDEVMCGIGRSGDWCAWFGLGGERARPDLQSVAKGLGAGYQPIGAVMVGEKVWKGVLEDQGGKGFVHGHTYNGHPTACAASLAVQKHLIETDLLSTVKRRGELLSSLLVERLLTPFSFVTDVRGRGLFWGVEFDLGDGKGRMADNIVEKAYENGIAVMAAVGADSILLAPPFIISDDEVRELINLLETTVKQVATDMKCI